MNCVGFVDGSVQELDKPGRHQQVLYNGHKRCHACKWQGIMLPNGIMPLPFGPINGNRHDSFMLERSQLVRIMRRICRHQGRTFCMYGDPAYPQSRWIEGPFKDEDHLLSPAMVQFNAAMSAVRIPNEWGFGKIKGNFAFLDFEKGMKPYLNDIQGYWPVAQILCNCHTCLYGSQTSLYFQCRPPQLPAYMSGWVRVFRTSGTESDFVSFIYTLHSNHNRTRAHSNATTMRAHSNHNIYTLHYRSYPV